MDVEGSQHTEHCDAIVNAVLTAYGKLQPKFKPQHKEWVPIAGIVACKNGESPICIAACTGMKSLPQSKLQTAQGRVLHDCHAEVLAIRALNAVVLLEISRLVSDKATSSCLISRRANHEITALEPQAFAVHDDVELYMYCSEAPCGDASMELIMEEQADATPWQNTPSSIEDELPLMGRGNFDQLGVVRRKPARPDAPVCLSKSCTDKLALRQCTSLLNSATALFVHPSNVYLHAIILPTSKYRKVSFDRAFQPSGRLEDLCDQKASCWPTAYAYRPFRVLTTSTHFDYSRELVGQPFRPSNKSAIFTAHFQEILVNGIVQGRKVDHPAAISRLSRRKMWSAANDIVAGLNMFTMVPDFDRPATYAQFKSFGSQAAARKRVKRAVIEVLGSWPANTEDDFEL